MNFKILRAVYILNLFFFFNLFFIASETFFFPLALFERWFLISLGVSVRSELS